jgi:asparagine synthase (glutamine-hydrolysing)
MCGIAGWVSYQGDLKARQDVIAKMTKTIARRGPDSGAAWIDCAHHHVAFAGSHPATE